MAMITSEAANDTRMNFNTFLKTLYIRSLQMQSASVWWLGTVGSHLQISVIQKRWYLNAFIISKATPTISSYFCRWQAGFSWSNGLYLVFQGSV